MSADKCTGLVKNVISHYCFKGSSVLGASSMPWRHLILIELVISSYLTGYWRKISLQPLSDCSSPGAKIISPGIKLFLRNFQFRMAWDWRMFCCLYRWVTDQATITSGWLPLVTLLCWSFWIRRWHCPFGSSVSAVRTVLNTCSTDYNLIFSPEKCSLFDSLDQAHHPVQLKRRSLCLVVNLSHCLTEPPIWVISCILTYLRLMIFWGFNWYVPQSQLPFIYLFCQ